MNRTKKERILAMRECLQQVRQKLVHRLKTGVYTSQYICCQVDYTNYDEDTKADTRAWIDKAIYPHYTFNGWMDAHNNDRVFTTNQLVQLRIKWIDQLCRSLTKQARDA